MINRSLEKVNSEVNIDSIGEQFDKADVFEKKGKFHYWMQSKEAMREFMSIDRDKEDAMVRSYLKDNDQETYNDLYSLREQTLWHWARRYAYLTYSVEDMFSDLCSVWINAIHKYNYEPKWVTVKNKAGNIILDENGKPILFN